MTMLANHGSFSTAASNPRESLRQSLRMSTGFDASILATAVDDYDYAESPRNSVEVEAGAFGTYYEEIKVLFGKQNLI